MNNVGGRYCCDKMKDVLEKYKFIYKSNTEYRFVVFLDQVSFCYSKGIKYCPFCGRELQ